MKKLTSLLVFVTLSFFLSWHSSMGHTITQSNFNSVITPKYMASGNTTRLPVMFRATVKGLSANTTYRYYIQGALSSDFGTFNSAGSSLLVTGSNYSYIASGNTAVSGSYATFKTNSSGRYTGWFGLIQNADSRFNAGNKIYPVIIIGDNSTGTVLTRKALDEGILVLAFSTSSGANKGSFLKQNASGGNPKDIVLLYGSKRDDDDNAHDDRVATNTDDGRVATNDDDDDDGKDRPLFAGPINGISISIPGLISGYTTGAGGWNAIIPNNNEKGVRRIEDRSVITGNIVCPGYTQDEDGHWPANTVNPHSGTTPLVIGNDAALVDVTVCSSTQSNVSCNGGNDGSAHVVACGGTGCYSYSWAPACGSGPTVHNLSAGTYTVTITDKMGCKASFIFVITQPHELVLSVPFLTDVSCNGAHDGSATVSVLGGTPPYSYLWLPTGGANATASGLGAGLYVCIVTDANGCHTAKKVLITQPSKLFSSISSKTNVSCNGGSNGSATVNVTGGTSPYSYSWSPAGGTAATGTGLSAGTYTCLITDPHGCTKSQTVTISQPTALVTSVSSQTNVGCFGGNNGSASINVSGGEPPYTYSWAPSGGTGSTASGLTAGTYTCNVTDSHGCSKAQVVIISQFGEMLASVSSQSNVGCYGGSDGSATIGVTGGTGPYTYSWSPSGGTGSTASGLSAGSYTCSVNDAHGCSASVIVVIGQPTAFAAEISEESDVTCNGGNNGSATVSVSGGTSPYTYSWSPSGGTGSTASGLSAGSYTCSVNDAHGCSASVIVVIGQPTALAAEISEESNVTCNGGDNGSASVSVSGGTSPYTYSWSPSGGTGSTASGLSAGSYTSLVNDSHGCSASVVVVIGQPTVLAAEISEESDVSCNGGDNGLASISVSGGTLPYTYGWSPSGGTESTANGLSAGSYTCSVNDANGCSATVVVVIGQPTILTAEISEESNVTCNGGDNGSASVSVSGGTSPYTYSWSPSGGTGSTAGGLSAGSYTCLVNDSHGCSASVVVSIEQPTALSAEIVSESNVTCFGESDGSAAVSASGGVEPYSYSWSPAGGNEATGSGLSVGEYTCTITDANGCTAIATVSISQPSEILVSTEGNPEICIGASAQLFATGQGGTGDLSFGWMPGQLSGGNVVVSPEATTVYTVTATDEVGCTGSTTVSVIVHGLPLVTAETDLSIIDAGLFVQLTASGASEYVWMPGNLSGENVSVSLTSSTTFTVTGTSEFGCNNIATVSVTVLPHGPQSTKLRADFCGATLSDMTGVVYCDFVPGATNYQYHFTDLSNGSVISYVRGNSLNNFFPYQVSQLTYGKTYNVQVRPFVSGQWGTYGPVCSLTTPIMPLSKLMNQYCGVTLINTSDPIYSDQFIGATNYEYEFTNVLTNAVLNYTRGNNLNNLFLFNIPQLTYGETYNVRVRLYIAGTWGSFGPSCSLTMPAFPGGKLSPSFCNATISDFGSPISCVSIPNASNYEYEFTDQTNSNVYNYVRGNNLVNMFLWQVPQLTYNRTYNVRVRGFSNGAWGPYGDICTLTTPAFPATQLQSAYCNVTLPLISSQVFCNAISGANDYEYEVTDVLTSAVYTKMRGNNLTNFSLSSIPQVVQGKQYNVRVRAYVGGVAGPYGSSCSITTPSAARASEGEIVVNDKDANATLKASVYPNPTSNFVTVKTNVVADKILVCDILGKTIKEFKPESESYSINFIDQENGLYLIKVVSNDQQMVIRVLLNK